MAAKDEPKLSDWQVSLRATIARLDAAAEAAEPPRRPALRLLQGDRQEEFSEREEA